MTGYGSASRQTDEADIEVEIRTLNSKGLDLSVRLPRAFSMYENTLRRDAGEALQRGKVSLSLAYKATEAGARSGAQLNEALIRRYYLEAAQIADQLGADTTGLYAAVLRFPEVLQNPEEANTDAHPDWPVAKEAFDRALEQVQAFREQEGRRLQEVLRDYKSQIKQGLEQVRQEAPERLPHIRQQLRTHLQELLSEGKIDAERLEQELVYFSEKLDIEEELVRLDHHLRYFDKSLQEAYSGKRLNFIAQEMGREINTIGSKANHAPIQRQVVMMKEALDKIKEQVLNVL